MKLQLKFENSLKLEKNELKKEAKVLFETFKMKIENKKFVKLQLQRKFTYLSRNLYYSPSKQKYKNSPILDIFRKSCNFDQTL